MSPLASEPSRDEVLDAFAVEPSFGRETLERYLRNYPQFALELVDLSRELSRAVVENEGTLSAEESLAIDAAWKRLMETAPTSIADPFATLTINELRDLATRLDVPRQVITAFRERKVDVSTVPKAFMAEFAALLKTAAEQFMIILSAPSQVSVSRSYKADERPDGNARISFEQVLIEAGVAEERRASLMARRD
jgi:hypothetical protein